LRNLHRHKPCFHKLIHPIGEQLNQTLKLHTDTQISPFFVQ
jgi:hypothetical protein